MKKITLLLFLFSFFVIGASAQTIVSTTPQNKKVILEEFTGVNCVYCPQGHAIANSIKNSNPTNVFLINVHVGGFATPSAGQPDFRTQYGTAIANQSGLTGYPAGTINRAIFTGLSQNGGIGTAMNRNNWNTAANQTLAQSSYVNVATAASIDANTRVLTVLVEAYYTGNSPVSSNKLNVALLQNNTLGPQTGGNLGDNYNHQHRLVDMLTGQWGEAITATTSGSFVTRTYTYTIPASFNNINAEMGNFEIVAFMAETQQKIISGNGTVPTYTGLISNDALVKEIQPIAAQCTNSIQPKVEIQNYGQSQLTSLPISYSINGSTPQIYNWTGNLNSFGSQVVTLPAINYSILQNNTLDVTIPSDGNNSNNSGTYAFVKAGEATYSNIKIKITLDQYGSETSWFLKNSAGVNVATSPTYGDAAAAGSYPQPDINLTLPNDCYTFTINDQFGDGINSGYGVGTYQVQSNSVTIPGVTGSNFGSSESRNFGVANPLANENFSLNKIKVYPNPSNGLITIDSVNPVNIIVTDISGKQVYNLNNVTNQSPINLSNLQKGIYLIKLSNEDGAQTEKIILK